MGRLGAYRELAARSKNFVTRMVRGGSVGAKVGKDDASSLIRDLKQRPRPLISRSENFGVLWSGKGGSMAVTFWFFARLGLLNEAHQYARNPHNYRIEVLLKEPNYRLGVDTCDPITLSWLHIIRSPYKRAVSSYRHVLHRGLNDAGIERALGISIPERGLSFQQFLDYLLRIDIATCDVHYRQQWHPIEAHVALTRVINLDRDPLLPALDAFTADIGLPPMKEEMRATMLAHWQQESKRHHTAHNADREGIADIRFLRTQGSDSWPAYDAFLTSETRRKIEQIYAKDFVAFGDFL